MGGEQAATVLATISRDQKELEGKEVNARNFNLQSTEEMLGCQPKANQGGNVIRKEEMIYTVADISSVILSSERRATA